MIKFQSLAQFPLDHLRHAVMSALEFLFCQFSAFVYRIINFLGLSPHTCLLSIFALVLINLDSFFLRRYLLTLNFEYSFFLSVAMSKSSWAKFPQFNTRSIYIVFFLNFCFQDFMVIFLLKLWLIAAVINLFIYLLIDSSNPCINAWTQSWLLASPSTSFLVP